MHPAELGELEAFRALYAAAGPELGAGSEEVAGAFCIRLDAVPESSMFNRALGLGVTQPATEADVDAALAFLQGVRAYLPIAPGAKPPELAQWLEARGLVPDHGWTKFSRSLDGPPPCVETDLRVELDADGPAFADAAARGFGVPDAFRSWLARLPAAAGWQCFVALAGDEPAGAGALYVTGEVGWLGIGATAPEHRGKGAQSALLARRIEAARAAGCAVVVTETGEPAEGRPGPSYRNILRAGFEPQYVRPNYVTDSYART
jgi:GNAT superfamily N-acetyltransferase